MDSEPFFSNGDEAKRPMAVRKKEAADMLSVSESTLDRLTKAGEIPRSKYGTMVFYRVDALKDWLARHEVVEGDGAA